MRFTLYQWNEKAVTLDSADACVLFLDSCDESDREFATYWFKAPPLLSSEWDDQVFFFPRRENKQTNKQTKTETWQ